MICDMFPDVDGSNGITSFVSFLQGLDVLSHSIAGLIVIGYKLLLGRVRISKYLQCLQIIFLCRRIPSKDGATCVNYSIALGSVN